MDESLKLLIILPLVIVIVYAFFVSPFRATMYIIAFQKIIDILWFVKINVGSFALSVQRIAYTIIPIALLGVLYFESQRRQSWPKIPYIKYIIIIYTLWYAFNGMRSPYLDTSIEYFFKVIAGFIMLFVGWYYFDSEEKFDEFAKLYIITYLIPFTGVILQATGIFQMADIGVKQQLMSNYGFEEQSYRYAGFYNDSGTNTMYLWTLIPLSLYFLNKENQKNKWFYLSFLVISVLAIIIGFSRGMYLAMFLVFASWFYINKQYWVLFLGLIGIISYFILDDFLRKFFNDLVILYETGKFGSVSGKAQAWEIIDQEFARKDTFSKIFGSGLLSNEVNLSIIYGRKASGESNWYSYPYDLGYLGFILYILIPTIALTLVWKFVKISENKLINKNLSLKYKAWFSMLCVHILTLHGGGDRWVSFTLPLWFLSGFVLKHPKFYMVSSQKDIQTKHYLNIKPQLSLPN